MEVNIFNPGEQDNQLRDKILIDSLNIAAKKLTDFIRELLKDPNLNVKDHLKVYVVSQVCDMYNGDISILLTQICTNSEHLEPLNGSLKITYPDNKGWVQIGLDSIFYAIDELKSNQSFEVGKHTYNKDSGKRTSIYTRQPLPKEYWHTLKPWELADAFDSLNEFETDPDNVNLRLNLQSAKQALKNVTEFYKDKDRESQIKNHKKMVELWEGHVKAYDTAHKEALRTDYPALVERKRIQAEYKAAQEAERIEQEEADNSLFISRLVGGGYYQASDRLNALRLFRKYHVEITDDKDVFRILQLSDIINNKEDQHFTKFGNDLPPLDKYIQHQEIKLKDIVSNYSDKYLKANGQLKELSHRQTMEASRTTESIRVIESELKFIKGNCKQILEFIKV